MRVINGTIHAASRNDEPTPKQFKVMACVKENAFFLQVDEIVLKMELEQVSDEIGEAWERWVVE